MTEPFNPYAPPRVQDPGPLPPGQKPMRLFSPTQVAAASFFGSALAGAMLVAHNEHALGKQNGVRNALALGAALCVGAIVLTMLLPGLPPFLFSLAQLLAMRAYADVSHGHVFRAHIAAGGQRGSNWVVVGAILGVTAVLGSILLVGFFLFGFSL